MNDGVLLHNSQPATHRITHHASPHHSPSIFAYSPICCIEEVFKSRISPKMRIMKTSMEKLLLQCLLVMVSIPVIAYLYAPLPELPTVVSALRWAFPLFAALAGWGIARWNGTEEMEEV